MENRAEEQSLGDETGAGKLKVEEDWFSDVERIHREHEVMDALQDFVPKGAIPKVLHVDYINHIYMMTCAEEEARTWKDILMKKPVCRAQQLPNTTIMVDTMVFG